MSSPNHQAVNRTDARDYHLPLGNVADSPPHVHFIVEDDEDNDINDGGDSGIGNGDELVTMVDSTSSSASSSDENETMLTLSLMSGGNNSSMSNAANSTVENRPAPESAVGTAPPPTEINDDGRPLCQHYGNVPLDEIEMYVHGLKKFPRRPSIAAADSVNNDKSDKLNSGEGSSITDTFCMMSSNRSKNIVPLDEIAMLESGLLNNQCKRCCLEQENGQPSKPIEMGQASNTKLNNES